MTQQYTKLKALLLELFQLDQPDLDFGLYRVMHAKRAEVTTFLDNDLLPQVQQAFAQYQSADKAEVERELAKAVEQAQGLGVDPETTQKVKDLRAKLKGEAVDVRTLEREVYDHLYAFFRRYYSEGDYLAKRVYKPGVYAIPYEGEEVTLHWANKDQYYIKTSEYLRNYAFRLGPDDEANPMRVHFRLVDAAEGEHGNVKVAEGKERRFKLAAEQPLAAEHGELVVRFTYLPDARKQAELNAEAEAAVLGNSDPAFADWVAALKALAPTEKDPRRTVLAKHLKGYSDRNTFDYFIHKDLGGFLRRELDFYIKNEVMHLDDVESETAPRVEQYLSKIKVVRRIAGKIIDFLAQLEDFQKKLWLKKKFVVETSWCIRLGVIPEEFYAEIAANEAQREEWVRLCAIDTVAGDLVAASYSVPLTVGFLKGQPSLLVDSRLFEAAFLARLLESLGDLDEQADGVLFHSENFQALSLLHGRERGQVRCVYIDPPYNTGSDGFAYKDSYKRSTWATMTAERIAIARPLLAEDGLVLAAISDIEVATLRQIQNELLGEANHLTTLIWNNEGNIDNQSRIKQNHEYVTAYAANNPKWPAPLVVDPNVPEDSKLYNDTIENSITKNGPANPPSTVTLPIGFPCAFEHGIVRAAPNAWPRLSGEVHASEWRTVTRVDATSGWSSRALLDEFLANNMQPIKDAKGRTCWFKLTATGAIYGYKDRGDEKSHVLSVLRNFGTTKQMSGMLARMGLSFDYPKPVGLVQYLCSWTNSPTAKILDYFAGSGTTGHAVINLNREDGGRRKFILVEMGDYFDTVLLPRIKKVTYTPEWKDGKPKRLATAEEAERAPRIVKVLRLESYEDALNNLETRRTDTQQLLLDAPEAQGPDGLKEQYVLRYMLNVETRGSQSLLNVQAFTDPTAYKLKVKRPGSDESREVHVDLLETFNWLVGLTVRHIAAPQIFSAAFVRDGEGRLRLKDERIKQDAAGPYWFRTVTGTTPDGRKALVIWRKLTGDPEQDNLVLDEWFTTQGYSAKDSEFDLIYVNGGNNLENLKTPDDRWKVRLIEEDFHRLMFEGTEGT